MKQKIVVLTGAGVSAESGFATFRDTGGLWEQYDVNDVASIEGWYRNRKLVLDFYNQRRAQLKDAKPNAAHLAMAVPREFGEHGSHGGCDAVAAAVKHGSGGRGGGHRHRCRRLHGGLPQVWFLNLAS